MTAPGLPMAVPSRDLPTRVRIHEVGARDGLQNEKATVPTEVKAEFIRRLADAGLTTIEATSFVHPKWVPQLADAERLFPLVSDLPVALPVLVPNERGLDRALALAPGGWRSSPARRNPSPRPTSTARWTRHWRCSSRW